MTEIAEMLLKKSHNSHFSTIVIINITLRHLLLLIVPLLLLSAAYLHAGCCLVYLASAVFVALLLSCYQLNGIITFKGKRKVMKAAILMFK